MLDKFFILCYNILVNESKRGIKMKRNFWELIFPNRIVYYFGTKEFVGFMLNNLYEINNPNYITEKRFLSFVLVEGILSSALGLAMLMLPKITTISFG